MLCKLISPSGILVHSILLAATAVPQASAKGEQQSTPAPKTDASASARDGAAESPQRVEIRGSAESYDARRYDTATKIVMTREEIVKNGDRTIVDVLKRLPGVTIGNGIRMRGLGNGYTQILINGDPMPPGFALDTLEPELIERVEVMRSGSAEHSMQGVAGTINVILRRAAQKGKREVKFGLLYDTDPGAFANFDVSDQVGKFSYSVAGGAMRGRFGYVATGSENAVNARGELLRERSSERDFGVDVLALNLAPRLNWAAGANDTVSWQTLLNFYRNDIHEVESTRVLFGSAPPLARTARDSDIENYRAKSDINWVRKLGNSAKLENKFGLAYSRLRNGTAGEGRDFGSVLALLAREDVVNVDEGITASGKYSMPAGEGHSMVFGWDGGWSRSTERRVKLETSPTGLIPDNIDEDTEGTVRRLAVFVQDEWNVSPRWSMYAGVRWEGIGTTAGLVGNSFARNRSSVWSPVLQTLYKLPNSEKSQVRMALARTYKAPKISSLLPRQVLQRDNSEVNPDLVGNPDLKAELALGLDLSYEHFLKGGGSFSIGGYARHIDDVMRTRTVLNAGRWISRTENFGGARSHGLEFDAKLPLRSLWAQAAKIDLRVNVTRNWSSVDAVPGPNDRLDGQVPISGTAGFDYSVKDNLTLGASLSYQGEGEVRVSQEQYRYATPTRLLDAYVAYKFNANRQLRISLTNILHQDRISGTKYVVPGGSSSVYNVQPSFTFLRAALEFKL